MVLLERAGELISKQQLMARVWPNIFVEPANLTVHISALRRALHDGQNGNRFIINIPGRGYCFVAPVFVTGASPGKGAIYPDRLVLAGHSLSRKEEAIP
jgi:DNA-binding winged helix-turn-helix (wHTH) protein